MPMDVKKYGGRKVWEAFSKMIRFERAGGRCECGGDCATDATKPRHRERCTARDGELIRCAKCGGSGRLVITDMLDASALAQSFEVDCAKCRGTGNTGKRVILTVAHLWKKECPCAPAKCLDPTHVAAMCQGCHLSYDMEHHVENRRRTAEKKRLPLLADLF